MSAVVDSARNFGTCESPDDEPYAGNDKWYAQPLTHIEYHIGFKGLLVVLDKLDEETAEEHPYEEDTEY